MTSSQLAERRGSQRPRVCNYPPYPFTAADDAIGISAKAGLILDDWQEFVLRHGLGFTVPAGASSEHWTSSNVSVWVPRQNGKGGIIEALELYWLFVLRVPEIVHSAHEHRTCQKAYERLERIIRSAPSLHRRVKQYRQSHGEQLIELHTGEQLQYATRSGTAVRGFSTPKLVLDEAQELTSEQMAAIRPTVSAMPNWQIWFFGTPPRKADAWCYGLRSDGEAGVPRLAHFDWGADLNLLDPADLARVHDRDLWFATNPASGQVPGPGVRILEETIEGEVLPSGLGEKFVHERLGVWLPGRTESSLIDIVAWQRYASSSPITGIASLSLDTHPDRLWSSIGMTGRRPDGPKQWDVLEHRPGMTWLLASAVEINGQYPNCGWSVDPASPAGALIPDLEKAGLVVHRVTGQEMAQATTAMLSGATDGSGRHFGHAAELDQAWRDAKTTNSGDGERFARRKSTGNITPLMVVTLSDHGFRVHGETKRPPPLFAFSE